MATDYILTCRAQMAHLSIAEQSVGITSACEVFT